jgi:dihydroxyacetone kinase-like protein
MLPKETLAAMLKQAAANIAAEHENLSALDAATGDGDHGVTINRTMKAAALAVDEAADKSMADLIKNVAMKIMMCDGGSVSPLLGSWVMGLASAAKSDDLSAEETAVMFEAGLTGFFGISKAELGDKTMMDAMRPGTETLAAELRAGADLGTAFAAAAAAADEGRAKTKDYVAKFGRARTMGERAIGHYDAGATSIALIFKGFAEAAR